MVNHIKGLLIFVGLGISLITSFDSHAQSQNLLKHNWYFGNTQRSIRFNRTTNVPSLITDKKTPFGTGGSAVATDRGNGNLLFYTDGKFIYDAANRQMPGGFNLQGNDAANQPVAITPVPGRPGKYFVFTNDANFNSGGTIRYTIVDMNLFGSAGFPSPAFGDVEAKNLGPLLTNVAEGMITLPHSNGEDFWLITQNVNSLTFNATRITPNSYGTTPVFNTVVSTASDFPITVSAFGYHEGLKKLAAAPQDPSTNAIIMDFDEGTGQLSFDNFIKNSGVLATAPQAIYDIEWSESGEFLYLSRHGDALVTADVLQYNVGSPSITLRSVLPAPVFRSYGLQRAPDGKIYHLFQSSNSGPFTLGRIEQPDSVATKAQYNAAPAGFVGLNFDGKQFPGFPPKDTVKLRLDFTFAGTCQNSPTTFFPFVRPGADSLQWTIEDTVRNAWSPIHTYRTAGSVQVKLRAFYKGSVDSVSKPVVIRGFPLTLQMTEDTTACKEEFPPPRGSSSPKQFSVKLNVQGGTPQSIVWSNGDTGPILTPDSAGYYYAVVTDAGGCSAYRGVNVKEYGLQSQIFNKWYFGNKAGIDFTKQPALALNESAQDAPEGVSIVCDRNGQQIFYTDGNTVYDKTHAVIATGIGGNPRATQSALIVPVPGDETIYYIFTTQDFNGSDSLQLKFSMFDLKENAGKGAVVKSNVLMYMKNTERITANGQWLIVHELGNATFRSYPIRGDGLGNPVYSEAGTIHSAAIAHNADGYLKLGPRNIVAAPISTPGVSARIEIFRLSDTTGVIDRYRNIDLNDPNASIYGVEFSPAGNKLFASVRYAGGSSAIYEYSIDSLFRPHFRQKLPVVADLGAIQIAPDGQLYVAVNNAGNNTSLGMIAANEDTLATSSFNLNGFALAAGSNSWLGLPNFIQQNSNQLGGPDITIRGLCSQDSTRFSGTPRDQIDEYNWSVFRAGSLVGSSQKNEFALLLSTPGDYLVTLQLHNRCAPDTTMSKKFTITAPPANPSRGVPLCDTPSVTLDANPTNVAGLSYQWTTGETSETLDVTENGLYIVDITDAIGCKTRGQFITADSRPIFDLGPDITICEGSNTPSLNVQNPGMTYQWTINGVNASTTAIQDVDDDTPGVYTYAVTVSDPITSCKRTEDKMYTINVSPSITLTPVNASACGATDGSVTLTIAPLAGSGPLFQYFIQGPGGDTDGTDAVADDYTLTGLNAGTYTAIVRDQVSNCTSQISAGLSDTPVTMTAAANPVICDPFTIHIVTTIPPASFPFPWSATNSNTGFVTSGTSGAATFDTPNISDGGPYTIEVRDPVANCTQTLDIVVTPNPQATIVLEPNLCDLTLTANSTATTFDWTQTPLTFVVDNTVTTNQVQIKPTAGLATFIVKASGGPAPCPGTDSLTVNVIDVPVPTLSQTDGCDDFATMSVNPDGPFSYRWFVDGAFDPAFGGQTIQLTRTEDGKDFSVTIYEPQSGCTQTSGPLEAQVEGEVTAQLRSTPPCDDDQPITLTATTIDPTSTTTYAWFIDGTSLTGVTDSTTQQTAEGLYKVEISKGVCKATSELSILRAPLPVGELKDSQVICDDPENTDESTKTVDLDPGIFVSYEWYKNGVLAGSTDRVFTADTKGKYEVEITDARGCKNRDKAEVLNDCLPWVNAPNAFKPGSNKFNLDRPELTNSDFWLVTRFIEEDNFKVFIFNRWGEMVFSSTDRFFKWNGGFNNDIGRPLPPGTYSYVVQYISSFRAEEGVKEKRGGVALIR